MKGPGEEDWKRHEDEQRAAWLRLSPAQRLQWLWQAKLFARRALVAAAARRGRPPPH